MHIMRRALKRGEKAERERERERERKGPPLSVMLEKAKGGFLSDYPPSSS